MNCINTMVCSGDDTAVGPADLQLILILTTITTRKSGKGGRERKRERETQTLAIVEYQMKNRGGDSKGRPCKWSKISLLYIQ